METFKPPAFFKATYILIYHEANQYPLSIILVDFSNITDKYLVATFKTRFYILAAKIFGKFRFLFHMLFGNRFNFILLTNLDESAD